MTFDLIMPRIIACDANMQGCVFLARARDKISMEQSMLLVLTVREYEREKISNMETKDLYWQIAGRSFGVYSRREQDKIRRAKIVIVGVGCDGGMDAYILARMGVGKLKLVDFDTNEMSNMNRQPAATFSTLGIPKVYAAKMILRDLNPTVDIEATDRKLTEENAEELLLGYDI